MYTYVYVCMRRWVCLYGCVQRSYACGKGSRPDVCTCLRMCTHEGGMFAHVCTFTHMCIHEGECLRMCIRPEPYIYRRIRCTYGIFSRETTIHTVIYGADIWFWPTLPIYHACTRVDLDTSQAEGGFNYHRLGSSAVCRLINCVVC